MTFVSFRLHDCILYLFVCAAVIHVLNVNVKLMRKVDGYRTFDCFNLNVRAVKNRLD